MEITRNDRSTTGDALPGSIDHWQAWPKMACGQSIICRSTNVNILIDIEFKSMLISIFTSVNQLRMILAAVE